MNRLLARLSIIVAVLLVAASVVSSVVAQSKFEAILHLSLAKLLPWHLMVWQLHSGERRNHHV